MTRIPLAVPVLAGGALGAASATSAVTDPDLYWHLATAREILTQGLARTESFSWTAAGTPLGTDQWLGQLLLYGGYAAGEWVGVLAIRALAVALLVGLTVAAALARQPRSPLAALAIALPALLLGRSLWSARPELFGAACLAALVLLLQLPGRWPLVATAPLLILWANLHGSFALGAGLTILVAVHGTAFDRSLRGAYLVALAGALASIVLTPAGAGTLTAPGIHLLDPPRQIQEWSLPDPTTAAGALWVVVLALVVATAALAPAARARDVALIVPTALLSLLAIRFAPLFAVAATPFLAERLPLAIARIAQLLELPWASLPADRRSIPRRTAELGALAIAVALLVASVATAPRELDEAAYPTAALTALPSGRGLLGEYDWGGWLIWHAPGTPVFVDGRLIPYRDGVIQDYEGIVEARPGWRDAVARLGVRWLLVRPTQPVAVRARDLDWRVLSRSPIHVLIEVPIR